MAEYFYAVDENDNIIGKATREECHKNNKIIHRSVYVFLLNDNDELFLQKRSEAKDLYGGYYTGSATGHVEFGEDYDNAARRELKEELEIEGTLKFVSKIKSFSKIEREISALYVCRHNGPVKFNQNEVSEGIFLSIDEVKKELKGSERKFAWGFRVAFEEFLKHFRRVHF